MRTRAWDSARTIRDHRVGVGDGGRTRRTPLTAAGDRVIGVDLRNADVEADLGTPAGRAAATERVTELSGGVLDGLVTLAGLAGLPERPASLLISVNYYGTVELLAGLRPLLARGTDPAAIAISSNSTTSHCDLDEGLIASCLEGNEEATRALAGEGESLSTYPVTKTALSWWVRRHAPTPEWAGAGITLNAVVQRPSAAEHVRRRASTTRPSGRSSTASSRRWVATAVPTRSRRCSSTCSVERALLLRIDRLLRRRDGRAVPGRRLAPTLEAVMATHDELDAIEHIKKLKARYFRCMDTKDWDGFQAVFADDASMDTTQEAPNIEVVVGAPQIRQFVEGSVVSPSRSTPAPQHMPRSRSTSPTTATGIWRPCWTPCKMPEGSPLGLRKAWSEVGPCLHGALRARRR